jgi:hypothetical protein
MTVQLASDLGYDVPWLTEVLTVAIIISIAFFVYAALSTKSKHAALKGFDKAKYELHKYHVEKNWNIFVAGMMIIWLYFLGYPHMPPVAFSTAIQDLENIHTIKVTAGQWFWMLADGGYNQGPKIAGSQKSDSNATPLSVVESMRDNGDNLTANIRHPLNENATYYTFTKDRREVSTPNNNSHTNEFGRGVRIALINPSFTSAAYNNSFYIFYEKYANTPSGVNVTSDPNLLSNRVSSDQKELPSSSSMVYLLRNIKWLTPQSNITLLADENVDNGTIFKKNSYNDRNSNSSSNSNRSSNSINSYDLIILGHDEYLTQQGYDNLRHFVANGGTMIIMDGNVFFAQVKYDRYNHTVTLVKGHWWAFNGKSAWKSIGERWKKENSKWVGSNYLCYKCVNKFINDPFGYAPHEEQYVTNPHDIILMNYNASLPNHLLPIRPVIATYELNYQSGKVIALGIYSEDIIGNAKFDRYFDNLLLQYALKVRD